MWVFPFLHHLDAIHSARCTIFGHTGIA
jgi:hypothetical protein